MKIRRFFARDMRSGLAEISKEMGVDAAILSTNRVKGGIEIVAATDYEQSLLDQRHSRTNRHPSDRARTSPISNAIAPKMEASRVKAEKGTTEISPSNPAATLSSTENFGQVISRQQKNKKQTQQIHAADKLAPTLPEQQSVHSSKRGSYSSAATPTAKATETSSYASIYHHSGAKNAHKSDFNWGVDPVISGVKDELQLIRGLLQSQLAELSWTHKIGSDPVSAELLKRLVASGLPVSLSESYILKKKSDNLKNSWYQIVAALAHDITISAVNPVEQGGCFALVGPTGVGKTTTLAKMAAMAALKYGADSVAMISTDSYRIAAHEQLTVYGQIMGVQVISVADAESLGRTLQKLANKRLLLIDTAGIGQRDQRLAEQVACLTRSGGAIQNLLVLSATAQLASVKESVQRFGALKLTGAILTKLDETTSLGAAITTLIRTGLALSFVTNGQNVPDDIHPARAHDLIT